MLPRQALMEMGASVGCGVGLWDSSAGDQYMDLDDFGCVLHFVFIAE